MQVTKKKAKTKPYQFQIDPDLQKKAMEKAASEGLLLSHVIRRFLMDYINNPQCKLFH